MPPQCFGDAVLCGSAKELHAIKCNTRPASSSSSGGDGDWQSKIGNGDPTDGSGDPSSSTLISEQDVGDPSGYDATGFGYSRTCPLSDISFSVMGKSVVIPLADKCGALDWLRMLLLAIGYFVAAKIVAGVK